MFLTLSLSFSLCSAPGAPVDGAEWTPLGAQDLARTALPEEPEEPEPEQEEMAVSAVPA